MYLDFYYQLHFAHHDIKISNTYIKWHEFYVDTWVVNIHLIRDILKPKLQVRQWLASWGKHFLLSTLQDYNILNRKYSLVEIYIYI